MVVKWLRLRDVCIRSVVYKLSGVCSSSCAMMIYS